MTLPRQVLPNCDYMITRRCSERRLFLRPDTETNNAFLYCLGLAAGRANVQILFAVAMSNHHHTGIHDPDGNFPVFIEHFHGLLARCQNAHLGRFENFWSSEPTSVVRLVEPNDVLDKMIYAYSNPCAAGLVDKAEQWPGATTFPACVSTEQLLATRPKHFFRDNGSLPDLVTISIVRPRGFETLDKQAWTDLVTEHVRRREGDHRRQRAALGISVLGADRVRAQNPFSRPKSSEPHFQLSPKVACKNKWARIESILRNKAFLVRYKAAFLDHIAGLTKVIFPFGTYWMRKFGRVACETGVPDWALATGVPSTS